jgi:primase-polymerase (primpol)-like protein
MSDLTKCLECGEALPATTNPRRPRRFHSNACRQKHYRKSRRYEVDAYNATDPVPEALRLLTRWVRHRAKRPIATGGWAVSVHDTHAWASYAEVRNSTVGDGYGFVLNGDGIVCIDLDDCVVDGAPTREAAEFVECLGDTYSEFSPSGRGLHVWGFGYMDKGRRFTADGLKVEAYPAGRFITVTGKPYRRAGLGVIDLARALKS